MKHTFLFSFVIFLAACTHTQNQPLDINITVKDPDRIRFHGKGAGAGMMLTSSMGPMGIAIGVAIDEGIGKDIDATAQVIEFDIKNVLRHALQQQKYSSLNVTEIQIDRYGFVTQPGDNDPVAPQLHISWGEVNTLQFPEQFKGEEIPTAPLAQVKTKADVIDALFSKAALMVGEKIRSASQ